MKSKRIIEWVIYAEGVSVWEYWEFNPIWDWHKVPNEIYQNWKPSEYDYYKIVVSREAFNAKKGVAI